MATLFRMLFTDGNNIKFFKENNMELSKEQMEKIVWANDKVVELHKMLSKAQKELWDAEKGLTECEWRNTKMSYWKDICAKYPEDKLLNCYGDIFFIDKEMADFDTTYYLGRRVLWNLSLSEEHYEIVKTIEYDADGDYEFEDYSIKVIK